MSKSTIAKFAPVFLLALVSGWALPTGAAVPTGLTQQGRILDEAGVPLSGEVSVVFTVYDDPEAALPANVLWTETQNITLEDGYFSTRLGDDASNVFPPTLFNGSLRYLGVQVGADEEMRPRERVGSVPYAFMANDVVGAIHPTTVTVNGKVVIDAAGDWKGTIPDRAFTTLISQKTGTTSTAAQSGSSVASCDAGQVVTGGGCILTGTNAAMKGSYPGGASQWTCICVASSGNCTVTPYAICAKN